MDYAPVVTGNLRIAHYTDEHKTFDGIVIPTRRRVYRRNPDGTADKSVAVTTPAIDTIRLNLSRKANLMTTHQIRTLTWDTYVAPAVPIASTDLPPGHNQATWSPISATLISGERDAVLVDALMTTEQAQALADWVAASGKNLTTVYVTHGHGDHWFGLAVIRERFPNVRAVATPAVVEYMRQQASPQSLARFWNPLLPGQISQGVAVADPLDGSRFELEGYELVAVDVGHTDTDNTTVLHVPSIGLVVAGDAAYNDVHVYLAESDRQKRQEWIRALDTIESLHPEAVVAGHKRAGRADHPRIVEETRQYIRDVDCIVETAQTARELYDEVLAVYPDRVNPGALWLSAKALKG
jgi:glyoxylase-like metal-dependent hydrolase (beta-lactamase superfamily II)